MAHPRMTVRPNCSRSMDLEAEGYSPIIRPSIRRRLPKQRWSSSGAETNAHRVSLNAQCDDDLCWFSIFSFTRKGLPRVFDSPTTGTCISRFSFARQPAYIEKKPANCRDYGVSLTAAVQVRLKVLSPSQSPPRNVVTLKLPPLHRALISGYNATAMAGPTSLYAVVRSPSTQT